MVSYFCRDKGWQARRDGKGQRSLMDKSRVVLD